MPTDYFADQATPVLSGIGKDVQARIALASLAQGELAAQDLPAGEGIARFAFAGAQADRSNGYAFPRLPAMAFYSGFDNGAWQNRAAANDASGVADSLA